jgi:hypothetical protein
VSLERHIDTNVDAARLEAYATLLAPANLYVAASFGEIFSLFVAREMVATARPRFVIVSEPPFSPISRSIA